MLMNSFDCKVNLEFLFGIFGKIVKLNNSNNALFEVDLKAKQ